MFKQDKQSWYMTNTNEHYIYGHTKQLNNMTHKEPHQWFTLI